MKVAIYVRVSTLEQAEEGYSIDEQIDTLKKFCEVKKWSVYKIYSDPGLSGSNLERPGLSKLISDAKYASFDTVLVYKLDRLSRSQKDTLYIIEDVFGANGISFVSLKENFDTSSAFGKAMIGILAVFAQLEREQIRERMIMGKVGRAKSGKAMSWRWSAFGYKYPENGSRDTYEIDPLEAEIVRQIFNEYLEGISITKLKDKLNNEGHIGKDKPWSYKTIRSCLSNPVYAGLTTWKDKIFEGNHEPIVSKEKFDLVQEQLKIRQKKAYEKNNNPRPFQAKYMLSGLLRCGICEATFEITLGNIRKDGSRLKRYKCISKCAKSHNSTKKRNPNGCVSPNYDMEELEQNVLSSMEELRLNPTKLTTLAKSKNTEGTTELEKRLNSLNNQLEKLVLLYIDNDIPKTTLEKKKELIVKEQRAIKDKIEKINKNRAEVAPEKVIEDLNKIDGSIFELSYEDQNLWVRKLIKEIVVYPDHLSIHWKFVV